MGLNRCQRRYIVDLTAPLYTRRISTRRLIPRVAVMKKGELKAKIFGRLSFTPEDFTAFLRAVLNAREAAEFNVIRQNLRMIAPAGREAYAQAFKEDKVRYARVRLARYYLRQLPSAGIQAYDLVSAIYYARYGCALGLVSKKEAREQMRAWAVTLQKSYSSWQELYTAFYAGRQFASGGTKGLPEIYDKFGRYSVWFLSGKLPAWGTPL